MTARRLSPSSLGALLCSSVAVWISRGTLAVAGNESGAPRIGVLPSFWWLGLAALAALAIAFFLRPQPRRVAALWLSALLLLPWLPVPFVASGLIFTGPLRTFVWIAVACGLLAPLAIRFGARSSLLSDPRRAPWIAAALAAIVYLGVAWSIRPRLPAGDEPHYLVIAQSLLRDHDLQIENNHTRGDYREYYALPLKPDYLRRGANDQIYSIHAPGLPAVVAPVFALFGYNGVIVLLALISAATTGVAWSATWRLTDLASATWFGWATVALTVPFVFEAFTAFPDGLGGSIVMVGVFAALTGGAASQRSLIAVGAALALLPWLHTRFAVPAGVLGSIVIARQFSTVDRGRRIAAFLAVPIVSGLAWFWFFYSIYGTPNPAAPYGGYTQSGVENLGRGLTGLLLDQQFGVLPYAPVYLCALLGFAPLARRAPRVAGEIAGVILPYTIAAAAYYMWWGGFSPPARFLTTILLPLSIPAGVWFANAGAAARLLACGGLLLSLVITATLALVDHGRLVYNVRDGASLFLIWLAPVVNLTTVLPSLFQSGPMSAWLRGGAWLMTIAATAATGAALVTRRSSRSAMAVVVGLVGGALAVATVGAVWRATDSEPIVALRQGATLLRAVDPSASQVAVRFNPLRRLRVAEVPPLVPIAVPGQRPSDPLVTVAHPAAGTYVVEAVLDGGPGRVTAGLDRIPGPLWTWDVTGVRGPWKQSIRLPVPAGALQIDADASTRRIIRSIDVRAERVAAGPARFDGFEARRAGRYGPATVYHVGGAAFMEPPGAWVYGYDEAEFIIVPDAGSTIHLVLRNFAADNVVTIVGRGNAQAYSMKPGEERTVDLPVDEQTHASLVRVKSARGARRSDVEEGSLDMRMLGCWIETR